MAPSSEIWYCVSGLFSPISESARAATSGGPSVGSRSHLTKAETAPASAISADASARRAMVARAAAACSLASVLPLESSSTSGPMPLASLMDQAFSPSGASPERLRDLAGFRVSELPWFALETPSYRALDDAFALAGSPFAALYALGVDAFRLAERLPLVLDGSMTELLGSTGELSFTPSGRVQRRLARAEVRAGRVQVPGTVGR